MADLTSTLSLVENLEKVLSVVRIASNINLVCFMVTYYDWITTLSTEIELVWKANWTRLTLSYLLARYFPLVYCPMILYYQFDHDLSELTCTKLYNVILLVIGVGAVCAGSILTIRTVAVWGGNKCITYIAFGLYAVSTVFILLFMALSLKHTDHKKPPEIASSIGCIQKFPSLHLGVVFITGTIFDTANLGLLLIRGASLLWWGRDSRLFRTVYGDGLLFYVYMSAISIANVTLVFSSGAYQGLMVMVPGALRSILACKVILHLRMQRDEPPMIGMSRGAAISTKQSKISLIQFRAGNSKL